MEVYHNAQIERLTPATKAVAGVIVNPCIVCPKPTDDVPDTTRSTIPDGLAANVQTRP